MKTSRIYLNLLFLSFFFFGSCKKNEDNVVYSETVVNGRVINLVTGAGLANVPVNIFYSKETYNAGVVGTVIQTIYTDAAGNYTYRFTRQYQKPNSNYRYLYLADVGSNPFYTDDRSIEIPTERSSTIDFHVRPLKTLQLHLKVMRHDRAFIILQLKNPTIFSSTYGGAGYNVLDNPAVNLDSTFHFPNVPQGLNYDLNMILANKVNYQYTDSVIYHLNFAMNADTLINYTIP